MTKRYSLHDDLIFLPLGGSGEIGMNLNLYCCRDRWIMVDCGMTFAGEEAPGVDLIFPDPSFIAEHSENLEAIILTHGHEDHIGAVPYLWKRFRAPIYTTPFTAELVRGKMIEAGLIDAVEIHEIPIGEGMEAGPFKVTFVPIAHSIAEGNALRIDTPYGILFHTGDWKLDARPQIGTPSSPEELTALGTEGVLAMVGDSTNVFNPETSGSEGDVLKTLLALAGDIDGRLVITTFASNVARLKSIGAVAKATNRRLAVLGRSLHRIIAAAQKTGYLQDFPDIVDERDIKSIPQHKLLVLATGCQGEPRAAMARLANDSHGAFKLADGDTVIFSSKIIPGNEISIGNLANALVRKKVHVITEKDEFVHVSGHPGRVDLADMYEWIKPKIAVPVHGEDRHLAEHAKFALEHGAEQAIVPRNGHMIRLAPGRAEVVDEAPAGRLYLDGRIIVPGDTPSLADRRKMQHNGYLSIIFLLDEEDLFVDEPVILARGLPDWEPGGTMEDLVLEVAEATLARDLKKDQSDRKMEENIRHAVRRVIRDRLDKNPLTDIRLIRVEA